MAIFLDSPIDEGLARGGTFDITGVGAVTNKQFYAFTPGDTTVLDTLKGVPNGSKLTTLAGITAVEVDLKGMILTGAGDTLLSGELYRVDGHIITNVKLTSGSFHGYKLQTQITS